MRRWLFSKRLKSLGLRAGFGYGALILGAKSISIGDDVSIMRLSQLHAHDGGSIRIGNNVSINTNTLISAANGGYVEIGNNVAIAQNVVIRASDHVFSDTNRPFKEQGHAGGDIFIEDDVWIAANVVITRNCRIGAHSIVAAGAVVTRDVLPWTLVGGVPAQIIKRRE